VVGKILQVVGRGFFLELGTRFPRKNRCVHLFSAYLPTAVSTIRRQDQPIAWSAKIWQEHNSPPLLCLVLKVNKWYQSRFSLSKRLTSLRRS